MALSSGALGAHRLFDGRVFRNDVFFQWENGRIHRVQDQVQTSRTPEIWTEDLVLPGLINLHAHLELTSLAQTMPKGIAFPQWVEALRARTKFMTSTDWDHSVQMGIRQSLEFGTTSILDVGNSGANLRCASLSPLRLWASMECLGLQSNGDLPFVNFVEDTLSKRGYSAHAIYSCSESLWKSVLSFCKQHQYPFTFHLAESEAEQQLLCHGQGSMRNWLDQVIPNHPFTQDGLSPMDRVKQMGIAKGSVVVHGNLLQKNDFAQLAQLKCAIVHCPQSARWFAHPKFELSSCVEQGLPVCIGTDSLASAESLSLWEQLALFAQEYPSENLESCLARVTSIPAAMIQKESELGVIAPGAQADFIVVRWNESWKQVPQVQKVFVQGQCIYEKH